MITTHMTVLSVVTILLYIKTTRFCLLFFSYVMIELPNYLNALIFIIDETGKFFFLKSWLLN